MYIQVLTFRLSKDHSGPETLAFRRTTTPRSR